MWSEREPDDEEGFVRGRCLYIEPMAGWLIVDDRLFAFFFFISFYDVLFVYDSRFNIFMNWFA